jgi:hypothetical protein
MEEANIASDNDFVLTRYLYSKIEVFQSLMISILERKTDEALFWVYEIYYSGFEDEVYGFVYRLYKTVYESKNPKLQDFIFQSEDIATTTTKGACHLGSMIFTLCLREYDLLKFIDLYYEKKIIATNASTSASFSPKPNSKYQFRVILTEPDIDKYKTKTYPLPGCTLKKSCEYQIRSNINTVFNTYIPENREQIYFTPGWLKYAMRSPIWENRIREHGGKLNNDSVEFDTEEHETAFYDAWSFEPEEQSKEIQDRIGMFSTGQLQQQLTLKDFVEKYGYVFLEEENIVLENTLIQRNEEIKCYVP